MFRMCGTSHRMRPDICHNPVGNTWLPGILEITMSTALSRNYTALAARYLWLHTNQTARYAKRIAHARGERGRR